MSLKRTKLKSKQVKESERRLRKFALGFREVREDHPWGHSAFKVKGKTFLFMAKGGGELSLSVKLPEKERPGSSIGRSKRLPSDAIELRRERS